jgi:hypothetical protein
VIITGGQSSRGRRDYRAGAAGAAEAAAAAGLPVAGVGAGVAADASGDEVKVGVGVAPVVDAPGDAGDEVPDSDVVSPDVVGAVVSPEVVVVGVVVVVVVVVVRGSTSVRGAQVYAGSGMKPGGTTSLAGTCAGGAGAGV